MYQAHGLQVYRRLRKSIVVLVRVGVTDAPALGNVIRRLVEDNDNRSEGVTERRWFLLTSNGTA